MEEKEKGWRRGRGSGGLEALVNGDALISPLKKKLIFEKKIVKI